jgi:WD40 repeat protein
MPQNTNRPVDSPRVFISYARADGEDVARDLYRRLEHASIPCWMDRFGMEGGRDWREQIIEALNAVEFLVLVMTPTAIQSPNVQWEWRSARQEGVCVYPVNATQNMKFASLPRWMRDAHFYDLDREWTKFLNDLNTRCEQRRVPFMVEDLPPDFVPRPNEFQELISKLLNEQREEPVAITAALRGAGGYGKTTMARALCHDERIQEAFDDGILWVTFGEHPGNIVDKIKDLIFMLNPEQPIFTGIEAATTRLMELLADRDILLVIDDVWNEAYLKPFLQGGKRCARLITTRDEGVLPPNAQSIPVDAMRSTEAVQLLSKGVEQVIPSPNDGQALQVLATRLGEWPLLLKLANGMLRERVGRGQPFTDALVYLSKALDRRGLTAFDATIAQDRHQAVRATMSVSFELLSTDEYARYKELAIFPEDVDIPLATVQKLWGATGRLDDFDTEDLCGRLYRFSLLLDYNLATGTIRLHDVVRTYLQQEVGTGLVSLHRQLLGAYDKKRWVDLPHDEPYLWDHLAYHIIGAGRIRELIATVKDLRYLATKALLRKAYAVETDLERAEAQAPTDVSLRLLRRHFRQMSHLLNRCTTFTEVASVLHSRLVHLNELPLLCRAFEPEIPHPYLTAWHSLPDLPHPALIRTLQGHSSEVTSCAVSPQGDYIVSASSDDRTLKVWDARTGEVRLTLEGHAGWVNGCVVSPDGDYIVSASSDSTLKVWDARTGEVRLTLKGHTFVVSGCAVSPQGDYIVSASADSTLKVWDARTGEVRLTLEGHAGWVTSCAVSPDGDYIVSASADSTLKVWDARTGKVRLTLRGHSSEVRGCAVSPDGDYIVSASADSTLKVWDAHTGEVRLTLKGHTNVVRGCAVSPDGDYIVSASSDNALKVWDARTGKVRLTLRGHSSEVRGCAVSPDGSYIISASSDRTLKVWASTGTVRLTLQGHTNIVRGCAVSLQGDYIVSASDDRTLKVWDARTGEVRLTLEGHTDWVRGCAVSPQGDYIVSASDDRTLKVWDARTGEVRLTLKGHAGLVTGCVVSPQGDYIVSASDDRTLKVWDARTGEVRLTLQGHSSEVNGCAVSPDGDYIVSVSSDRTLKVWDARTGEVRLTLKGHTFVVRGCAVSPDGAYIVSASSDSTLKVWDARTGEVRLTLKGHTFVVRGCAVSPDGSYIISASSDNALKVWDARTGRCLCTLFVDSTLWGCAFHPDSEHIVAVGAGGVYFLRWIR